MGAVGCSTSGERNHILMLCALDMAMSMIICGILSLIIETFKSSYGGKKYTKHVRHVARIFEPISNNNNLRKALITPVYRHDHEILFHICKPRN